MDLRKIDQPLPFKQHAYEELKNGIINHVIQQGEVLTERNLSESLGISRTPLREAIQLLELEGWVKTVPRKGVFINHISAKDVEEVLQLRRANESLVIELILPHIKDHEIDKLEEIYLQQSEMKSDRKTFISLDKDFHMYLAELSRNDRLIHLMHNLSDQMRWFGIAALTMTDRVEYTLQEHRNIIESIKSRDFELGKTAISNHIMNTLNAILNTLQLSQEE